MTPQVAYFVDTINQLLPEPHASLLAGMLFGVRRTMPDSFYDALVVTGTLHVIALSGMNVSIIIRLMFGISGSVLGRIGAVVVTLCGIIGFVWLVGPSPTIIRASIMGSLTIVAVFLGRKDIPLISLVLAASIMLLFDRTILTNISFQLSFGATLGIILFGWSSLLFASKNTDKKQEKTTASADNIFDKSRASQVVQILKIGGVGLLIFLWTDLRVSLAAQVFTTPLIMYYFGRVSLVSPVANVMTGWLIAPITYLGILTVLLAEASSLFGKLMALVVWVPLTLFIEIVTLLSKIPYASLEF